MKNTQPSPSVYRVVSDHWLRRGSNKHLPSLEALRRAVAQTWSGQGSVDEIRSQREKDAIRRR